MATCIVDVLYRHPKSALCPSLSHSVTSQAQKPLRACSDTFSYASTCLKYVRMLTVWSHMCDLCVTYDTTIAFVRTPIDSSVAL